MKRPRSGDAAGLVASALLANDGSARAVAAPVARLRNFRRVQRGWVTFLSDYIIR